MLGKAVLDVRRSLAAGSVSNFVSAALVDTCVELFERIDAIHTTLDKFKSPPRPTRGSLNELAALVEVTRHRLEFGPTTRFNIEGQPADGRDDGVAAATTPEATAEPCRA
ncbi:MAG: hypothetical protein QM733_04460 [Ilumatobacteraceae bacterium]